MSTPDRSPLGGAPAVPETLEAPEADVAEQRTPADGSEADSWPDAERVAADREWRASEADLIEQSIDVPDDPDYDAGFDR